MYEQLNHRRHKMDAVGRPLPHLSAQKHTTGEAVYVDDMPFYRGLSISTSFGVITESLCSSHSAIYKNNMKLEMRYLKRGICPIASSTMNELFL